jgi:hypothetical protein
MSIWSDIQDRSAGITVRKEDEINITLQDLTPKITFGVIKDIRTLPVASQYNIGKMYLIDTDCGIFNKGDIICNAGPTNGGWVVIGSNADTYVSQYNVDDKLENTYQGWSD